MVTFIRGFAHAAFSRADDGLGFRSQDGAHPLSGQPQSPALRYVARLHTAFETVEATWREMERDGTCTVYQRADWIGAIVRHLASGPGCDIAIVELRHALTDEPVMIWPLMRRRRPSHSRIEWLSCGVSDYAAPVLARGIELAPAEAQAVWQVVLKALPPADLIWLDGIPGEVGKIANPLAQLQGTQASSLDTSGIAIDGDPETLLGRVCGRSFLREFNTKTKRLAKRGEVAFVVASEPQEADELLAILMEQRISRFRTLGRFDLLGQDGTAAFYRETVMQGLDGGATRVFGLRCGDEWIAACTGLVHNGALHGSLLSIGTEAWRAVSPGLQLIAQTMVWSRRQGLDYVDFTIGALSYKTAMGATPRPLLAYRRALTARGVAVLQTKEASERAWSWLRAQPVLRQQVRNGRRLLTMMTRGPRRPAAAPHAGLTGSTPSPS